MQTDGSYWSSSKDSNTYGWYLGYEGSVCFMNSDNKGVWLFYPLL